MPKYAGTVAEFIVNLFAAQPDLEWRIAEIVTAGDNKWNAANVANSLARMLKAGKVKKNVGGGVWWSAASASAGSANRASPRALEASADFLPGEDGQVILDIFAKQPARLWHVREICLTVGRRWTADLVHKTMPLLEASGQVKKTTGRHGENLWQASDRRAAAIAALSVAPSNSGQTEVAAVVPTAAPAVQELGIVAPEDSGITAAGFILDLLTRHPDYEMQVADLWEEADKKWAAQTISNTLDRLVKQGRVARVKDGRQVWYSIAG